MKLSKILNYEEWNNMNGRMKININDRMSTLEPFISQVQPMPSYNDDASAVSIGGPVGYRGV